MDYQGEQEFNREVGEELFEQCYVKMHNQETFNSNIAPVDSIKTTTFIEVYIEAIRILQSNISQISQDLTHATQQGETIKKNFEKYGDINTETTGQQRGPKLAEFFITAKEGRDLKVRGRQLNKPMIKVVCGNVFDITEPAQNPVDPVWGHNFKFTVDIKENFAEIILLDKDGSTEKPIGYHNFDLNAIKDQKQKEQRITFYDDDGREIGGDVMVEVFYEYNAEKTFKSDYENVMKDINNATKNYIEDLKVLYTPFQAIFFEGSSKEDEVNYQAVMKDFSPRKLDSRKEEEFVKDNAGEMGEHFERYSGLFKEYPSLIFLGIWIFVYTTAVVVTSIERSMFFD